MSIEYALTDRAAEITLNRPEKLNALTSEDLTQLSECLDRAGQDDARAILVRAVGRAFCVGRDLTTMIDGEDVVAVLRDTFNAFVLKLAAMPVPTVAAVQGACVGAGTGIALACDIVMASADASFASPFGRLGGIPDSGFHWFVTTRLGPAVAKDMILTGRSLSGTQAAEAGLIARVVAPDELLTSSRDLVQALAAGPTKAFALSMPLVDQIASGMPLEDSLNAEAHAQAIALTTHDFAEGKAAFLGKRPPQFSGS